MISNTLCFSKACTLALAWTVSVLFKTILQNFNMVNIIYGEIITRYVQLHLLYCKLQPTTNITMTGKTQNEYHINPIKHHGGVFYERRT